MFYVPARSLEKEFAVIGNRVRTLKRGVCGTCDSLPQELDAMLQMILRLENLVCMMVREPWGGKDFFLQKFLRSPVSVLLASQRGLHVQGNAAGDTSI